MRSKRGRLDRFISQQTQISRNKLRTVFAAGKVSVDGQIETDPGYQIDEFSRIVLNSGTEQEQVLQDNSPLYLMLHKPSGVVSATKDDQHKTVLDLIDHPRKDELFIVGRLDLNSTGLLLLTNDSRWSQRIMAPEAKVAKVYQVTLEKDVTPDYIDAFSQGMYFPFEDITTLPAKLEILGPKLTRVTLQEGRYHQIKRMFGRFRNAVISLHRESIGELELVKPDSTTLDCGNWIEIEPEKVINRPIP